MKNQVFVVLLTVLLTVIEIFPTQAQPDTSDEQDYLFEMVAMRDGTRLATYVYLPDGEGPFPALVTRTIYGLPVGAIGGYPEEMDIDEDEISQEEAAPIGWPLITDNGYALVVQVTRGRFNSEGIDRSWLDDANDGYDLVEWVNQQSWSNGRIGMYGDSALGVTALQAASTNPPSLDALYVQATSANPIGTDFIPEDGGVKLESLILQGTSIVFDTNVFHWEGQGLTEDEAAAILGETGTYLDELLQGLSDPVNTPEWMKLPIAQNDGLRRLMPFWDGVFTEEGQAVYRPALDVIGDVEVPVYVVSLWQDVFLNSSIDLYADLQAREVPSRLLMLNGTHYDIDNPSIWPRTVMLDWFDYWLKDIDNGIMDTATVEYAVQGADNLWLTAESWPLQNTTELTLFLNADGQLTETAPETQTGDRSFVYDPAYPMPTTGGHHLIAPSGMLDQREIQARADVLTYTGEPLPEDTLVAGPVTATLWVTSDTVDTDFSVRLVDLHPDGTANLILDDLIRVRYRNGRDQAQLIEPGEMIKLQFELGHTAHLLRAGHSIQINVTSSDFPAWDRNLNTGVSSLQGADYIIATNTVFSNTIQASAVVLPVRSD
jgi:putative CocE/NonD family hydrolase